MTDVRVLENIYKQTNGFRMNILLKENLDILLKYIKKDHDFVILISGGGMVRIGKSMIAMQIGKYLTEEINRKEGTNNEFTENNFVFRGTDLVKKAKDMPKYSVLIYDEAGADLLSRKIMHQSTQAVLDFFREAGQLNLFLIVVLPDFFELPSGIAITRSNLLIDVVYKRGFERGCFKAYGWDRKKRLYLMGKKWKDYSCVNPDFGGEFDEFYTIDEQKYREMKLTALTGRKKDEYDSMSDKMKRMIDHRRKLILHLHDKKGMTQEEISEILGVTQADISRIYRGEYR